MAIYALGDRVPQIDASAYVHPEAVVIGDVVIGPESGVWPCAVLRGDYGSIRVGRGTSIQDGTVIHCTAECPTVIGDRCTIGHNAHLEGCTVQDDALVGSNSTVLHDVVVGHGALVGAGALVPNRMQIPPRAMALGIPAKIREDAVPQDAFAAGVAAYIENTHRYAAQLRRLD